MKKTLIAFSVTVMLSISLFLAVGLSGCNWFNTTILNKTPKTELEEKERQRSEDIRRLDSIRTAEAAKLAELKNREQEGLQHNNKPFHIIVGAFEEQVNVDNQMAAFKSHGYHPITIPMPGFTCVSAISYGSLFEAENALEKMLDLDYCPEDAWVLKKE